MRRRPRLAALIGSDRSDGLALVSGGAISFWDNADRAARYGVWQLAEPGGSTVSLDVAFACAQHGITRNPSMPQLF